MKITLTGKVNEVLIILTESKLTIDFVTSLKEYRLKPETTLKEVTSIIDKDLQEYALIPKRQINKVHRQVKQFNFR
jgi:hypothetical protein